jgi:hypothetical protein|nr:masE-like protein [Smithella sp. SCADC]
MIKIPRLKQTKEGKDMKCVECKFDGPIDKFRYLYNARIDSSMTLRQCPNCQAWLAVDELTGAVKQKVGLGEAPWGKSAGIEGLATD